MTRLILLLSLFASSTLMGQTKMQSFTISGVAKGAKDGALISMAPIVALNDYYIFHSTIDTIYNEKFNFSGKLKAAMAVAFAYQSGEEGYISAMSVIEKGKLSCEFLVDSFRGSIINILGSPTHAEYEKTFSEKYNRFKTEGDIVSDEMNKAYDIFSGKELDSALSEMRMVSGSNTDAYIKEISSYAIQKNNSLIPVFLMLDNLKMYNEAYIKLLPSFSAIVKQHPVYKELVKKLSQSGLLVPGGYFPSMGLTGILDYSPDSVSRYYNKKYILVDFWFAKCGACIRQFPAFADIVNRYKNTSLFNLVSISTDDDVEILNSIKTIEKYKADWIHLWDKKGVQTAALNITSFPTNVLLDETGKVIAIDMEPLELSRFLRKNEQ